MGIEKKPRPKAKSKLPEILVREAQLSVDGMHRYTLTRIWDHEKPRRCYILLNPSTADHLIDDPTVRRCVRFAHRDGFGSFDLLNLFALRSKDPKAAESAYFRDAVRAIGPENNEHLTRLANALRATIEEERQSALPPGAPRLVYGWGSIPWTDTRARKVLELFKGIQGYTLHPTAHGPGHPLYLPGNATLTAWP